MNKTNSTILIVFIVALIALLGIIAWKYRGAIAQEKASQQEASIETTISSLTQAISSGTATSSLSESLGNAASSSVSSTTALDGDDAPVAPITIVPQSGWTTYREDEYGVAGTYPEAWYEYDAVPLGGSLQFTSVPNSDATTGGVVANGVGEISIYRTPETLTQAEAEDSLTGTQDAETTSVIAQESVPVIGYTLNSNGEDSMVAYVSHDGYIYRIILTYHGEPQFSAIYSNFLATFQF